MTNFIRNVFGLDGVKIDTVLDKDEYTYGDRITGKVEIIGGETEQTIDGLDFSIFIEMKNTHEEKETIVKKIHGTRLRDVIEVLPGQKQYIDIDLRLPRFVPISYKNDIKIWLRTTADAAWSPDPIDDDYITIKPNETILNVINSIEELGFKFYHVEVENAEKKYRWGFEQKINFTPIDKNSKFTEIEFYYLNHFNQNLEVFIERDLIEEIDIHAAIKNHYRETAVAKYFVKEYNDVENVSKFHIKMKDGKSLMSKSDIKENIRKLIFDDYYFEIINHLK